MSPYSTLLIASPSLIVREGLKTLLHDEADLYSVGDVVSGDELLARAQDVRVDLLLLDLDLLDDSSENVFAQLRETAPATKIVALADGWNDARIVAALRGGTHGFVVRRSNASEIVEALHAAQSGTLVLNPATTQLLQQQLQADENPVEQLSARELEVLRELARGLPNKLIAQELIISEHTVKFHIRSILDKLNAANRTEAVRVGIERGLIAI